jgi:hypothetical protein
MPLTFAELLDKYNRGEIEIAEDARITVRNAPNWPLLPKEHTQVSIKIPDDILEKLAEMATKEGYKRAAYIRKILTEHVAEPTP